MSLRVAVAAPFKGDGRNRMREQDFVVDLAMDRNWVSPDQAKELAEVATREGLLERDDGELVATFDLESVTVPDGFVPDESIFSKREPFEAVLETLVDAGFERQSAAAGINSLQEELRLTADVAAVVFARKNGFQVDQAASRAAAKLRE